LISRTTTWVFDQVVRIDWAIPSRRHAATVSCGGLLTVLTFLAPAAWSQVSVTTQRYDNMRSAANTSETILTPAKVNSNQFGRLFTQPVDGQVYAQPLYLATMTIPNMGVHNVIFIATEHDSVYAFDADTNSGANANPLWQVTLLDAAHGAAAGATTVPSADAASTDIAPELGITSTPVIDLASGTIYVVSKTKESGSYVQRLHALDVTTGAEKFGGPAVIQASVPGVGNGSSGGTLKFDPLWENNRASLLLLNGVVYIAFGAHNDNGPWHGWVIGYNASTLQQTSAFCTTPNGSAGGIWMSGQALASDGTYIYAPTGNGTFDAATSANSDYGDTLLKLSTTNGQLAVSDYFTPFNQDWMNNNDYDLASSGMVLLPNQPGTHPHELVQSGKQGVVYVLNRDALTSNNLHYCNGCTSDTEIVQTSPFVVEAMWGSPTYWNNSVYFWGSGASPTAFSLSNGLLSNSPSIGTLTSNFPGPACSISANGNTNGILWCLQTDTFSTTGPSGPAVLRALDATNVRNELYNSTQAATRDYPGGAVKFTIPMVANGKVYVGTEGQVSVFGLLNGAQYVAAPVLSPGSESFSSSVSVTITDATPGATIYYTTDGSTPTTSSAVYFQAINVVATTTLRAIATAANFLESPETSATYSLVTQVPAPAFSPAAGTFSSPVQVTVSDAYRGAAIYYTTDGTTPTTSSSQYVSPVSIGSTATLRAFATASGAPNSPVTSGLFTINNNAASSINFATGFSTSGMTFNGSAKLSGTRLRLTDGGGPEAGDAFFYTPISIRSFTTDFIFQLTNANADGFTFMIQGNSTSVLGPSGGGLGYGPDTPSGTSTTGIPNSVAVKFDLYSNAGEGNDSTGLYTNAASPTIPAIDLTSSGINLHSGHAFAAHMVYNGTTLTMSLTDTVTNSAFTTSFTVDIPGTVGDDAAYVGFSGGTGGATAVQDILTWTFTSGTTQQQVATPVISPGAGTYANSVSVTLTDATSGASIYYTTNGSTPTTSSTLYNGTPITLSASATVQAIAVLSGYSNSTVASTAYTVSSGSTAVSYASGFTGTGITLNGSAKYVGTRLRLTDSSSAGAADAFYSTPVNVQSFTTDFTFQLTNANADGITFIVQNNSAALLGPPGGGLGYGPDMPSGTGTTGIPKSVAVKFDLYNNAGEGGDSTGFYTNGVSPTVPATDLSTTGINLHSGDIFAVHLVYDGTTLTMSIKDTVSNATFSTSTVVNIPSVVGGNTAYVGFGAGVGGSVATQEIITWTYGN